MKPKLIASLAVIFVLGAIAYAALLWQPLAPWLYENVILAINLGSNSNPGIAGGLLLMFGILCLLVLLFALPYILLWVLIIALILLIKHRTNRSDDF